jgi:hypothetical protein
MSEQAILRSTERMGAELGEGMRKFDFLPRHLTNWRGVKQIKMLSDKGYKNVF